MRALILFFWGVFVSAAPLLAQPIINPGGVINAASFLSSSSAGGAIAQGSIFSIFGSGLGPAVGAPSGGQLAGFPLSTTLAGVSVQLIPASGASLAAIPLYVSDRQINAILPSATPVGLVSVSVAYNGATSAAASIKVVRSSFGIFTRNSAGVGPAIAQNFLAADQQPFNSPSVAATPGQTLTLWGTGLGPIAAPDNNAPPPGKLNEPIELSVAGRPVAVDYAGRSPCCAGVDQINFRLPADAASGCAVPVAVKMQNGVYSNIATIAVSPAAGPCSDPWNLTSNASRWAQVSLIRTFTEPSTVVDTANGIFAQVTRSISYPPPGTCRSTSVLTLLASGLNAGPQLTLAGPAGSLQIPKVSGGFYTLSSATSGSAFLIPGAYTASGPGGPDVGAFQATLSVPAPPAWAIVTGDRFQGITWKWTGANSGADAPGSLALLSAASQGSAFLCTASLSSGSFTLPPAVLANLPAQAPATLGAVWQSPFTASGIDQGFLSYTYLDTRQLSFGEPPLAASPVFLPGGQRILAELAVTDAEQENGLMNRTSLASGHGMLFLFDRPAILTFWMYQTLIPLDIIWTDSSRRIMFISANTPPCPSLDPGNCPIYGPRQPSQYVLELAAGVADQYGLRTGDQLNW